MTQYIQENLPEMDKELARLQRREIGEEVTQMHLAKQFIKFGKYAKFSKDPEFKKRMLAQQIACANLMGKGAR